MFSSLLQQFPDHGTVITPNRRLATQLQQTYKALQTNPSWRPADILPWQQWVVRCYEEAIIDGKLEGVLLNSYQEQCLWRGVVQNSAYGDRLLNVQDCIQQAMSAWQLIHEWQVPLNSSSYQMNEDCQQFYQWAMALQTRCQQEGWITIAEMMPQLIPKLQLQQPVLFVGFDELTPLQRRCSEHLATMTQVEHYHYEIAQPQVQRQTHLTLEDEIQAMAQWAAAEYQRDPKQRVVCVVPNLTSLRPQLASIFRQHFYPQQYFIRATDCKDYNLSGGDALDKTPVVQMALQLMQLTAKNIPLTCISAILRSPYQLAGDKEMLARSKLEFVLFEMGESVISVQKLMALAHRYMPQWAQGFKAARALITDKCYPSSEWPSLIQEYLLTLGWPGERTLNSEEYQQMTQLQSIFDSLAQLDGIYASLTWQQVCEQVKQLCQQHIFQVETATTQFQILGLLEAAGSAYDKMWIMNLQDEVIPPKASPNPFIPLALQRELGLPHVNAQRELHYNRQLLQSLIHSSQEVILSYSQFEQDRELTPSPLIGEYDALMEGKFEPSLRPMATAELDVMEDDFGPAIQQQTRVAGGTGIFKAQGACPFQAFARYRLRAYGLAELGYGLSPLDRGIIIHEILQKVWQRIKNQHNLLQQDWQPLLQQQIQQVLEHYQQQYPSIVTPTFYQLEQQRLMKLLSDWLALEATRTPFKIVALEQSIEFDMEQLSVKVQLDRLDQLEGGELVLIDYKTGLNHIYDWFGERPQEPQLPLYAIQLDENIAALAFAQLNRQQLSFKGIAEEEGMISGLKCIAKVKHEEAEENMRAQLARWQACLNTLAQQFCQGYAAVDPKDISTCQYCDLSRLCRIGYNA